MSHHSFSSEPTSPYFLTYTYTSHRASEQQDNRSVGSNCTYTSRSSRPQSFVSTHRINQLKPKSKIVLSKCSTLAQTKKKEELSLLSSQPIPISIPVLDLSHSRRTQSVITESIQYRSIRPAFNWGRLNLFCGFERVRLGEDGCLCGEPCPWREGWIKTRGGREAGGLKKIMRDKPEEDNLMQIEKDLDRTFPGCPTFSKNNEFRLMLKNVLVWYSIYDRKAGYVQGMNMIAGVLVYHIKNAELAFWALVEMMFEKQLRTMYLNDFLQLNQHCQNILELIKLRINDLYDCITQLDIMPASFLNGWLLSLMSNAIPLEHMHRVVDGFKRNGWSFMYRLVLTYLIFLKDRLVMCEDQSEFLLAMSVQSGHQMGGEWEQVIDSCEKLIL